MGEMVSRRTALIAGGAVLGAAGVGVYLAFSSSEGTLPGRETVPMTDSDVCFMTAVELARRLRAKDVSARQIIDAHLRQIERVNPKVNAIVTLVADQAREAARRAD
jgi:hypothetical protein